MPDNANQTPPPLKHHFPRRQLFFWLVLLLIVPLAVMMFQPEGKQEVHELTASQFEEYLTEGRILGLKIEVHAGSSVH